MRVCDICKDNKRPCREVKIQVVKTEAKIGKRGRNPEKIIITIPVDLCEEHITALNKELGNFITKIRNKGLTET